MKIEITTPTVDKIVGYMGKIVERNHLGEVIKLANSYIARKSELRRVDVKGR